MGSSVVRKTIAGVALAAMAAFASGNALAAGDATNGKTLFARCAICAYSADDAAVASVR